jgi:Ca-activated chloride channel family protein
MELFRFANPDNFWFLVAIPVASMLWMISRYRSARALRNFGESKLVDALIPDKSTARPPVKFVLTISAFILLVIAAARPQYGSKLEEVKKKGVEVIIALDVSNSMLAEDIKPNRLERSKQAIERLVDQLDNDKIGLIVFAGDAYTQIPVTIDYISAKMFLSSVNTEIVPKQGTSLGAAINLGIRSFSPSNTESRTMVIITDGENHEDDPLTAAEEAKRAGVIIYTIGIGSPEGSPIPITTGGRTDFLKDREGNTVVTRLDEKILQEIALSTGGKYVRASTSVLGLNEIYSEIGRMKKIEMDGKTFAEYNDQFQYFAGLAGLLLLIELLVMERKNRRLSSMRIFRVKI